MSERQSFPLSGHRRIDARRPSPILLSIPHSGRDYPDWVVKRAKSGKKLLEKLEDPLVDRLAWRLLTDGHGAVMARAPRAAIDCNRGAEDFDPRSVQGRIGELRSLRAKVGMGLIPTRLAPYGDLWRRPLGEGEYGALIAMHHAYHQAISEGLQALRAKHSAVLLIDLHSMPPRPKGGAQIIIGDRQGSSAEPALGEIACQLAEEMGFSAARNDPFAGGHIVASHGRPEAGIHAIQVEICRSAYLGRDGRTPGAGFERVATFLRALGDGMEAALSPPFAIAAE